MKVLTSTVLVLSAFLAGGVDSLISKSLDDPKPKIEFRRAEFEPAEGLTEAMEAGSNSKVYLHKTADLTNEDIAEVRKVKPVTGYPRIEITFTKEGARKMEKLTSKERLKKPLAVLVDGKLITAPRINAKISDKCVIEGAFTNEQVDKLIKVLSDK